MLAAWALLSTKEVYAMPGDSTEDRMKKLREQMAALEEKEFTEKL